MATHSSIPAWKIPWTKEPGGLQSMGSQRVEHDLASKPPPHNFSSVIKQVRGETENRIQIGTVTETSWVIFLAHSPSGHCFSPSADLQAISRACGHFIRVTICFCPWTIADWSRGRPPTQTGTIRIWNWDQDSSFTMVCFFNGENAHRAPGGCVFDSTGC